MEKTQHWWSTTWFHAGIIGLLLLITALAGYVAWRIYRLKHPLVYYIPPSENAHSADAAMDEARTAHHRIDRIDGDVQEWQREQFSLRQLLHKIEGRVKFLLHSMIGTELGKERDEEAKRKKEKGG